MSGNLPDLLKEIRQCQVCIDDLPLGPNPIVRIQPTARLLIISQAPSTNVHQIAFMPMGFCYPGRDKKGGDLPPRKACAPLWHHQLLALLPNIELILLIGRYAQVYYLREKIKKTTTETVYCWQEYLPRFIPFPHPSWRNTAWLRKNPWFEEEVLPYVRNRIHQI
jgi:uracil-DNA glycosylase